MIKNKVYEKKDKFYQSKCLELLREFKEKELEGLTHIVACSYFNEDKYVVTLLDILISEVLHQEHVSLELYKRIYRKVFAEEINEKDEDDFRHQRMRFNTKMSALMDLVKRFLMIEALEENSVHACDLLYKKIIEKGQFALFNQQINYDEKKLEGRLKDNKHYRHKYIIEQNRLEYLYKSGQLIKKDNMNELVERLDKSFIADKLKLYMTLLSVKVKTSHKYDASIQSMENTEQLLALPQHKDDPYVSLCGAAVKLAKAPSESAYNDLLKLLSAYSEDITKESLVDFYTTASNFCSRKRDYQALFDLYQTMHTHEKKLLIQGKTISIRTLKQVINAACRVGAYSWAEEVLEIYKPYVDWRVRENVYQFNSGVIAFNRKKYDDALIHFNKVKDVHDINLRVIILKTRYENKEEGPIEQAFITARRYFVGHKKLNKKRKKEYINFMDTLIKIYRLRRNKRNMDNKKFEEKRKNIEVELDNQQNNADKDWLREKIVELKMSRRYS